LIGSGDAGSSSGRRILFMGGGETGGDSVDDDLDVLSITGSIGGLMLERASTSDCRKKGHERASALSHQGFITRHYRFSARTHAPLSLSWALSRAPALRRAPSAAAKVAGRVSRPHSGQWRTTTAAGKRKAGLCAVARGGREREREENHEGAH